MSVHVGRTFSPNLSTSGGHYRLEIVHHRKTQGAGCVSVEDSMFNNKGKYNLCTIEIDKVLYKMYNKGTKKEVKEVNKMYEVTVRYQNRRYKVIINANDIQELMEFIQDRIVGEIEKIVEIKNNYC
jgi:hypothetical protein